MDLSPLGRKYGALPGGHLLSLADDLDGARDDLQLSWFTLSYTRLSQAMLARRLRSSMLFRTKPLW